MGILNGKFIAAAPSRPSAFFVNLHRHVTDTRQSLPLDGPQPPRLNIIHKALHPLPQLLPHQRRAPKKPHIIHHASLNVGDSAEMPVVDVCGGRCGGVPRPQASAHLVAGEAQGAAVGVVHDEHAFELQQVVYGQEIIEKRPDLAARVAEYDGVCGTTFSLYTPQIGGGGGELTTGRQVQEVARVCARVGAG
jgi:hypothetical protein